MTIDHTEKKNLFDDIPVVDLKTMDIDREVAQILPLQISQKIDGIIIGKPDEKNLVAAVKDPRQLYIYDTIEYNTDNKYKPILMKAEPEMVDLAIEFVYKVPVPLQNVPWKEWLQQKKFAGQQLAVKTTDIETGGKIDEGKVTGLVIDKANNIISEAISVNASDIHLEPFEDNLTIRYRIDGVLQVMDVITDMREAEALIKRFKIMADMDIASDRVTQDGRISVKIANRAYDLRVSVVPVPAGESIVLRLLSKSAFNLTLESLGFSEHQYAVWKQMVSKPYGMILSSGPTGSGKSTTLFASLKDLNRPDRKLLTVEDPIEYQMPGIIQVQVNLAPKDPDKKVTFSRALREFLRQDPDVILVGEIRDDETANISVKAALTGHLVLSTIHTNDSVGIITRLKDMNVIPYLISSCFVGGAAQRLVRKLCPECRKPVPIPETFKHIIEKDNITNPTFYEASGCEKCRRTGYKGRIGLYEILVMTEQLRDKIETGATSGELYRVARSEGMKVLLEDGVVKAAAGIISPSEVHRVCMMDIKM